MDYQDLLASEDIDAVIITTPTTGTQKISIDAERAGKHVYVEKCMTRTMEEAHDMYAAFKGSKMKLQLGHQAGQWVAMKKQEKLLKMIY
ncbi:MAG: hypothetical protein CM1200mP10_08990 [Candidatus Neomarinimicrobiota bacterium]|nr:MAG: hypothetical protein CM1200mP10_08990 [Candidatus Neomarinimicrobiota bacterium]